MGFEPQKFFIGLIDFFAIILPGSVFAYLANLQLGLSWPPAQIFHLESDESWVAFLVAAYLAGQFLDTAGAFTLDKWFDEILVRDRLPPFNRLSEGGKRRDSSSRWRKWAETDDVRFDFEGLRQARRLMESYLDGHQLTSALSTLQWARARLSMNPSSGMQVEFQRFEAISKLFRGLTVAFALLGIWWLSLWTAWWAIRLYPRGQVGVSEAGMHTVQLLWPIASLLMLPRFWLAFARYRVKATRTAFHFVVVAEGDLPKPRDLVNGATHAGGVVFHDLKNGKRRYLLIRAKNGDGHVLPKGHIEPGESVRETAVREVYEEARCWASVAHDLGSVEYIVDGKLAKVRYFLMELEAREAAGRSPVWRPLDDAIALAAHPETRTVLERCRIHESKSYRTKRGWEKR